MYNTHSSNVQVLKPETKKPNHQNEGNNQNETTETTKNKTTKMSKIVSNCQSN